MSPTAAGTRPASSGLREALQPAPAPAADPAPAPAAASVRPERVAYLVNQYPRATHSFIRREIDGLELLGVQVDRYTMRAADAGADLPDPRDRAELGRTRALLEGGALGLAGGLVEAAVRSPGRFARALGQAVSLGWRSERGVLRHVAYLAEAAVLRRWLREAPARHLHAHFGTNSATVALLCRTLGGPPWSFTAHGPEEFDGPGPLGLDDKIAAADFVVGVSSFGKSQLQRRCAPKDWSKVHVVRCGLDAAFLEAELTPVPNTPRLVCVGRLCVDKAQLLAVEAVAALVRDGIEVELDLIGDGPTRPDLEAAIARHGLQGRVRLLGWASQDGVRQAILASRALVLPTAAEGLPVVLQEALALGRPVVTTWVAGIPELVVPSVSGWLVPAGSVPHLTRALREVLEAAPDVLARMGAAGRARVLEAHDARRSASQLRTLFLRNRRLDSPPGNRVKEAS
jgi:colanic acid/amylovoran biosynthesis glycosyltransferase